jgi:chromosome partitioning protein
MKKIAFFNNKGGVGKTTLVFHVAWMLAEKGHRIIAADLDPQANLTAMALKPFQIDLIEEDQIESIYDVVAPVIAKGGEIEPVFVKVTDNFALIPGDLELSNTEDALSREWTQCLSDSPLDRERAFAVTTSLAMAVGAAGEEFDADLALIDVGPNLGAINRSALLEADYVVVPVAPDIFSLKGLTNVGRGLADWRKGWDKRLVNAPPIGEEWPHGKMQPLGYVVSRFSVYAGERAAHFRRWINRVPRTFHRDILGETSPYAGDIDQDPARLAWLKDYRSLMPMAMEVNKPIFLLTTADGAIGGHQAGVQQAYEDFEALCQEILKRIDMDW